jgi:hypothetical protein
MRLQAFACRALIRPVLILVLSLVVGLSVHHQAWAQSRTLAPGFTALPAGASLLLMAPDVELFSISAGGIPEPKADWTDLAQRHIDQALSGQLATRKLQLRKSDEQLTDDFHEISALHAAVAGSISLHHVSGGNLKLPTKNGQLDWSLGDAVRPLAQRAGTDYALFVWMRDSYASAERKAAMVAMALLGVGLTGGMQVGYASLVDLKTGQVMWFNRLLRGSGDLREPAPAEETIASLLADFPAAQ